MPSIALSHPVAAAAHRPHIDWMARPWLAGWVMGLVLALHAWGVWVLRTVEAAPLAVPAQSALSVSWVDLSTPTVVPAQAIPAVARQRAVVSMPQSAAAQTQPPLAKPMVAMELPAPLQAPQEGGSASATTAFSSATTTDASPIALAPLQPAPPKLIPPSMVRYIEPPTPTYPTASRRLGESGTVVVRVFVDETGLPRTVQVAQSSGFVRLDEAAVTAVQQARFVPYTENGQATAGWARIPFPFELERSR
ncbi:MAG: energy transducer TonB [Rhizobacter sp.]